MIFGRNNLAPSRWKGAAASGFTLLEMVAVMAVMVLMLGIATFAMRQSGTNLSVEKPGDELVRLAKTAVRASAVQGHSFSVMFDKGGISLLGAQAGQRDRVSLEKGMKVFIKRFGDRSWQPAEGYRWWFGQQGLCEPLSVRIEAKDSAIMLRFNPLTGTASERELEMF